MRRAVLTLAAVAVSLSLLGCNYSEQKRQARAYEQFLKQTLGTVEPEHQALAQHATAGARPASVD